MKMYTGKQICWASAFMVLLFLSSMTYAGYIHIASTPKMDEQAWCEKLAPKYDAKVKVLRWEEDRYYLLNRECVIVVDWAPNWAEAVGHALYYGSWEGRKTVLILLVVDMEKEHYHIYKAQLTCATHDIELYVEEIHE